MQNKKKNRKKKKMIVIDLPCPFNKNPNLIDYKDVFKLKKFITTRGRLLPTVKTGVSAICQRKLSVSVKRARYMALLPYSHYV